MAKDFRASQIETSKIIASGSISGHANLGLAIYSGSVASNREGGTSDSAMLSDVGTDVFLFISGSKSNTTFARKDTTLFGGDVVISGTLYAERQVVEVDSVTDGDFYVTGNLYVEPDTNSTTSVSFAQANGTSIFNVDATNARIGVGVTDPDSKLEVLATTTQQKWSYDANSYATMTVADASHATLASGESGNITVDAGADIILDAAGNNVTLKTGGTTALDFSLSGATSVTLDAPGNLILDGDSSIIFKDGGTQYLVLSHSGGNAIISASVHNKDIIFRGDDAAEVFRVDGSAKSLLMATNKKIEFSDSGEYIYGTGTDLRLDAGGDIIIDTVTTKLEWGSNSGEHIVGDGSNGLTIASGVDINLTATNDVNIPSGVGLTFGNDAEKIEGDGTDLRVHGNNLILSSSNDVMIPINIGLAWGPDNAEKIEGDGTDINFSVGTGGDINIPSSIGLTFGNDGEKIEGNGTTLTIAGGTGLAIDSEGDLILDGDTQVSFKDGGTQYLVLSQSSGNAILSSSADDKDIIFHGNDATEVFRVDGSAKSLLVASGKKIEFADTGEYIYSDGTDLRVDAGGDISIETVTTKLEWGNNSGEHIVGDGSNGLTIASGVDINLTATQDINIPSDVGLTFGNDGEKIEGNGTTLTIAGGTGLAIDSEGELILDGDTQVSFKDGGTTYLVLSQSAGNAILSSSVHNKDIIFHGNSTFEIFRVDASEGSVLMNTDKKIMFRDTTSYINHDGTDLQAVSNTDINVKPDADFLVDAGADIILDAAGNNITMKTAGTTALDFVINGATDIKLDAPGDIKFDAAGNDYIFDPGGTESFRFTANGTTNATWDVAGDAIIDADGGNVILKDAGTAFLDIMQSSGNVILSSSIHDKDIVLHGNSSREFLRVDSSASKMLILSGGGAGSYDESSGLDVSFYVSGAVGSRDSSRKGAAVFGGDMIVSGTLFSNHMTAPSLYVTASLGTQDSTAIFVDADANGTQEGINIKIKDNKIYSAGNTYGANLRLMNADDIYVAIEKVHAGATSQFFSNQIFAGDLLHITNVSEGDILIDTRGTGSIALGNFDSGGSPTNLFVNARYLNSTPTVTINSDEALPGTDANFYVSGAIGAIGTTERGVSVFGGDIFISGSASVSNITGDALILDGDSSILFKDGGTQYLVLSHSAGNAIFSSSADDKDIIFHGNDAAEVFRIDGSAGSLQVDASGGVILKDISAPGTPSSGYGALYVNSDTLYFKTDGGTAHDLTSGGTAIDAPGVAIIDGGDSIAFKDDGTQYLVLSHSAGNAVLSSSVHDKDIIFNGNNAVEVFRIDGSEGSLLFNGDKKIQFADANAYIHHDGTDLKLADDADINLVAGVDVLIDAGADIILDAAGNNVTLKTGGTTALDFVINGSTDITLDAPGDLILDAGGGDIEFKDDGTSILKISNSSSDIILSASVPNKDIIFKGQGTGASTEIARFDNSASALLMASGKAIHFGNSAEYISGDGTDLDIASSGKLKLDYGAAAGSNLSVSVGGTNVLIITASSGNAILSSSVDDKDIIFHGNDATEVFRLDGSAGSIQVDGTGGVVLKDISAPGTPASGYGVFYVNSDKLYFKSDAGTAYDLTTADQIDAATDAIIDGGSSILFKDDGTQYLVLSHSAGNAIFSSSIDDKDVIFHGNDATEVFRIDGSANSLLMASEKAVHFGNSAEYISGDGTDLDIVSSGKIKIDYGTAVNSNVSLSVGGTNVIILSASSGNAILSSSVHNKDVIFHGNDATEVFRIDGSENSLLIASSKRLQLGAAEEGIYGDGTDIHFEVGANGDINIPANIGLTFGNDGEKIEGNGTTMTIAAGTGMTLDSEGTINIDADSQINFKDGGTQYLVFSSSNTNTILSSSVHNKDIIFHGDDATEVFRIDGSEKSLLMASGRMLQFGNANDFISGNGTDLDIISSGKLKFEFGTDAGAYFAYTGGGNDLYIVTASAGHTVFSASLADKDIVFMGQKAGNSSTEYLRLDTSADSIIFNETSADIDLRIESNDETHMLFVDGGNNRVSIGDSTDAPAATLEITNNASAGAYNVPLLQLNSNDTDQIALDINAANINANVIDIAADAVTTSNVINVSADGLTSGIALNLSSSNDSLNGGNLILANYSGNGTNTQSLVKVVNDNPSATGTTPIEIIQDSTGDLINATYGANGTALGLKIKEVEIDISASSSSVSDSSNFFPALAVPIALTIHVTSNIEAGKHITKIGTSDIDDMFCGGVSDGGALNDGHLDEDGDTLTMPASPLGGPFAGAGGDNLGINAAQTLRITHGSNPSTGAVRAVLYYWSITPPTS